MDLFYGQLINDIPVLAEEEQKHIRVLRKQPGDQIGLVDGKGNRFTCGIESMTKKSLSLHLIDQAFRPKDNSLPIMVVAPTKNMSRYEFMTEKLTEIGIDQLIPVISQHSERRSLRIDRLDKHALSAMKQSQRLWLPQISETQNLKDVLSQEFPVHTKLIAACDWDNPVLINQMMQSSDQTAVICIGPEGGFSEEELAFAKKNGWNKVLLSGNRLRTETAAIVAAIICQ